MKRYWKLILLAVVTFLGIGTFYFYANASAAEIYRFSLKDIEGDPKALEGVTIEGTLYPLSSYDPYGFKLVQGKEETEKNQSYLQRMDGDFDMDPSVAALKKEYRSFLRGKNTDKNSYVEDKNYVIYAADNYSYSSPNHQTIEISRLNKQTKKVEDFVYSFPKDTNDSYFYLNQMFYQEDRLTLLIQKSDYTGNRYEDTFRIYVWDFDQEKMVTEGKALDLLPNEEGKKQSVSLIDPSSSVSNNSKTAFLVQSGGTFDEMGEMVGDVQTQVVLYDYATLQAKEIATEDGSPLSVAMIGILAEDAVYFYLPEEEGNILKADITVEAPSLESIFHTEGKMPVNSEGDLEYTGILMEVSGNTLYLLDFNNPENNNRFINIYDLDSKKLLYKGKVEVNEGGKTADEYELYMNNIYLNK